MRRVEVITHQMPLAAGNAGRRKPNRRKIGIGVRVARLRLLFISSVVDADTPSTNDVINFTTAKVINFTLSKCRRAT